MPKPEIRINDECRNPNADGKWKTAKPPSDNRAAIQRATYLFVIRISSLIRISDFVIRHFNGGCADPSLRYSKAHMISALTGELRRVEEDRIQIQAGPMLYELLVPASDQAELQASVGQTLTLHTIFYLGGDPSRGGMEPTLIGFLRGEDRKFFNLFTTVKGIGPKTALKALTVPVGEIAVAIESKDSRFLVKLNGIGKRTAELIVAELAGKVKAFATGHGTKATIPSPHRRPEMEEDAILALMAMGERRPDAEHLLERAKQGNAELKTTDGLLREMLRMRSMGRNRD